MGVLRAPQSCSVQCLTILGRGGVQKRKNRFPGVHQEYQDTKGENVHLRRKRDRQIGFCSQTAKEVGGDNTAWFLVDEVKRQVGSANERTMEESASKETEREEFFSDHRPKEERREIREEVSSVCVFR